MGAGRVPVDERRVPEYSSIREELYLHVHVATGLVQAGYRVPVDELLPWVASTYYPSTRSTTTHYGRAPSMACPVGRPGTRVLEYSRRTLPTGVL